MKPPFLVDKRCRQIIGLSIATLQAQTGGAKWSSVLDYALRITMDAPNDDPKDREIFRELFDATMHLMCVNKEVEMMGWGKMKMTGYNPDFDLDSNIKAQWAKKIGEQARKIRKLENELIKFEEYVDAKGLRGP